MTVEVSDLLNKINALNTPNQRRKSPSTNICVKNFITHLIWLEDRHCKKKKTWSDGYLISECFKHPGLEADSVITAYCRINLYIATRQFEKVTKEMMNTKGVITYQKLKKYKSTIRDYIFDLKPIVEYLERKKNINYNFFNGQKYYGLMPFQTFLASRQLSAMSLSKNIQLDHKSSQIAATFMLRQALETKFDRLIGVILHDKLGQNPKLRHDFNYKFIQNNLHLFVFTAVDFSLLEAIYKWCNAIVHIAFQPLIWQLSYAIEISSGLFSDGPLNSNGGWSINGGVRVVNADEMQQRYVTHFGNNYDHGDWCVILQTPDAVCNYS